MKKNIKIGIITSLFVLAGCTVTPSHNNYSGGGYPNQTSAGGRFYPGGSNSYPTPGGLPGNNSPYPNPAGPWGSGPLGQGGPQMPTGGYPFPSPSDPWGNQGSSGGGIPPIGHYPSYPNGGGLPGMPTDPWGGMDPSGGQMGPWGYKK